MNLMLGSVYFESQSLFLALADACAFFSPQSAIEVFGDLMRARRYTGWGLRYLRLVNLAPCHSEHPNLMVMGDVAESLSPEVVLDTAFTCQCSGV